MDDDVWDIPIGSLRTFGPNGEILGPTGRPPSKPQWQLIETDWSSGDMRQTVTNMDFTDLEDRVIAMNTAAVGVTSLEQIFVGGRRTGWSTRRIQALGRALGRLPALGVQRRTKISAAVRSALEHWVMC